jgi:phage baseplate assembly protein gpV
MRGFIVMAMFVVSLSYAGSREYTEVRNLDLDASGLSVFSIDAGAGALAVNGVEGSKEIVVIATIRVDTDDPEDAAKFIEKRLRLGLERDGDRADLKAGFGSGWGWDVDAAVDLDVRMPANLALVIDDGSGAITINDIASTVKIDDGSGPIELANSGDVDIDDGSGSIRLEKTGAVKIDDGSGSITIVEAAGDVYVEDGSGTIDIRGVRGSVTVDDGSGDIEIDDVEHDLIIEEEGSGSLRFTNVRGTVQQFD